MSKVNQAASGISYLMAGSTAQMIFRLGVIAVLARHLSPTDFGIVAAAMIVVSVLDLEGALGIAPALIQRKTLEPRHLQTGMVLCLLLSPVMAGALFLLSPFIADLLSIPRSADALKVLSSVLFFRTLASVSEAQLYRGMRFARITVIQFSSFAIGYGICGISLALLDFGYWAIVYAEVAQAVVCAVAFLWNAPPPRKLGWNGDAAKELFRFGMTLSGAKLVRQTIFSIDQAVIARYFGAAALGYYTRATGTTFRPINALGAAIESVLFPMISAVQDDAERIRGIFIRGLGIYTIFVAPVVLATAVLAYEIVDVMLGAGWEVAALLMQLLAVGFFFRTANRLCATVLKSRGKASWLLVLQIEHGLVVIGCLLIGLQYGLVGVAIAASVAQMIHFLVTVGLVLSDLGGGLVRLLRIVLATAPIALVPIALGQLAHQGLAAEGLPWTVVGAGSAGVIGLSWVFAMSVMPVRALGADGVWIFHILGSLVPSRLPASQHIKNWIQRRTAPKN